MLYLTLTFRDKEHLIMIKKKTHTTSLLNKNMVAQHSPCINNHKFYENKNWVFCLCPIKPFRCMFCSKLRYYKTENWSLVTWHWQSAFYNDKPLAKQQKSAHSQSSCHHFIHRAMFPLQLEFYILKLKHWIVWLIFLIT